MRDNEPQETANSVDNQTTNEPEGSDQQIDVATRSGDDGQLTSAVPAPVDDDIIIK
jgi:hypothetical protein